MKYVVAYVDKEGVLAEANEGNNVEKAVVRPGPDLTVELIVGGPTMGVVPVMVVVANRGACTAAATVTKLYLSNSEALPAQSGPIETLSFLPLLSGQAQGRTARFNLPSALHGWKFYSLPLPTRTRL